ncbi:unnamed protein product, partial [Ilex paraguariensis]
RGASSSKFFNYLIKQIIPVFDELPEDRKLDLLKNLAECSHYVAPQDSRQLLPSVVQLLKKHMIRRKLEDIKFTNVECLLYTFHHLAHKTPNATNSLCGYKIVTGQPSDRLGEDFSEYYKDFTERLGIVEDLARAMIKKLTQGMAEHNRLMTAAKTDEEKNIIKTQKQNTTSELRACNNILAMTQKRAAAANGSGTSAAKKGREAGGVQNQLVHKALDGLHSSGRTGGRGRGWRGRGRGRGYR